MMLVPLHMSGKPHTLHLARQSVSPIHIYGMPTTRRLKAWKSDFPQADFWEVGAGHIYEVSVLRPLKYQRRTTPPLQSISLEIQPSRCSLFPSSAKAVETIILREPYLVDAFGSGFGCRLLAEE